MCAALVAAALLTATSCSQDNGGSSSPPQAAPAHKPLGLSRIMVLVMENKEYSSVIGSSDAPYTNALARKYTLFTQYYAITHPSLPNYLAMLGGSTYGISNDCTDCYQSGPNLVDQLEQGHVSWKAYMEGMPSACYEGDFSGRYAKKHNPFIYYDDIRDVGRRCDKIVPATELDSDLAGGGLPQFSFLTPDMCNDTHDCSVGTGDDYLRRLVPGILDALGPDGILVITYDEGDTEAGCCGDARGGRVVTIVAGPGAARHRQISTAVDHYSLLRLVEDNWGLPRLGLAGDPSTPSLEGFRR